MTFGTRWRHFGYCHPLAASTPGKSPSMQDGWAPEPVLDVEVKRKICTRI
jgi:hypothetical protein